jgi:hypothetical protein
MSEPEDSITLGAYLIVLCILNRYQDKKIALKELLDLRNLQSVQLAHPLGREPWPSSFIKPV